MEVIITCFLLLSHSLFFVMGENQVTEYSWSPSWDSQLQGKKDHQYQYCFLHEET